MKIEGPSKGRGRKSLEKKRQGKEEALGMKLIKFCVCKDMPS